MNFALSLLSVQDELQYLLGFTQDLQAGGVGCHLQLLGVSFNITVGMAKISISLMPRQPAKRLGAEFGHDFLEGILTALDIAFDSFMPRVGLMPISA